MAQAGLGVYPQWYIYPSTRQEHRKMGEFFEKIRQKSVREATGIRQAVEGRG
jgi:hypothetical protein